MPRASASGFKAPDSNYGPNEPYKVAWLKPHLKPIARVLLFGRYGMLLSNIGQVQCLRVLPGFHAELCSISICVRALCSYGGGCSAN